MKQNQQSGFSLVETLVAITILLVVIAGPLAISSSASKSSSFSSEQVVAFFLAQEGLELVQKARNDLLVPYFPPLSSNPDPWTDFTRTTGAGLYRNCYTSINSSGCDLTINGDATGSVTVTSCAVSGACRLYLDTSSSIQRSRYTHVSSGNASTPYTRTITLELVNANEVKVTSKVTWRTGSIRQAQEVVTETRLFNVYGF